VAFHSGVVARAAAAPLRARNPTTLVLFNTTSHTRCVSAPSALRALSEMRALALHSRTPCSPPNAVAALAASSLLRCALRRSARGKQAPVTQARSSAKHRALAMRRRLPLPVTPVRPGRQPVDG
jgi:hypothetical protein